MCPSISWFIPCICLPCSINICTLKLNTLWSRKWPPSCRRRIFMYKNICISIQTSLKLVSGGPVDKRSALFQVMAWCREGHAVIWTKDGLIHWPIYVSFSLDQLTCIQNNHCIAGGVNVKYLHLYQTCSYRLSLFIVTGTSAYIQVWLL